MSRSIPPRVLLLIVITSAILVTMTSPARAAVFTVTKAADTTDGTCDADCSLREAIGAANASSGTDTVVVPAGTYTLAISGPEEEDANASGDLDVTDALTLAGASATSTIVNGGGIDRVLDIDPADSDLSVSISGVGVGGGRAPSARGGGIRARGFLTLSRVAIQGNVAADDGGGIALESDEASLDMTDSVVSGNTALGEEGFFGDGGGIYISGEDQTGALTDTTVSGNVTEAGGGGIRVFQAALTMNNVTVTDNTLSDGDPNRAGGIDGEFTIVNSILAGNTAGPGGGDPDCNDTVTSQGFNIIGDVTGCEFTPSTGDQVGTGATPIDPKLGPLADNGGTTPTQALLPGSTAIDGGGPVTPRSGGTGCDSADQRGAPRTGTCDIGAYEVVLCKGVTVNRIGTAGNDVLTGTSGADGFLAQDGNDTAKGVGGSDAACMGGGRDTAAGGGGKDILLGEGGKDKLKGQGGKDTLKGGPGKDTCAGGGGRDKATCEKEKKVP